MRKYSAVQGLLRGPAWLRLIFPWTEFRNGYSETFSSQILIFIPVIFFIKTCGAQTKFLLIVSQMKSNIIQLPFELLEYI